MKKYLFNQAFVILFFSVIITSCSSPERGDELKNMLKNDSPIPVDACMMFAGKQLIKTIEQVGNGNRFPRYIKADGTWETMDSSAWSSGFFAGCLWFMYQYTSDESWKEYAEKWTAGMEGEKFTKSNHNNGFKMMSSFGNGYRLTGNEEYKEVLIESARSLASRYNEKVGYIKANEMEQWNYPVMVDTMVNLELLFWAAKNGGDPKWYTMAETHALNTLRHHVREDGSTIQVVDFDPETGIVIGHDTLCGLSGDSAWSRGQGQAIYGFTMAYRQTKNPELLEAAHKVADYFIENLPKDYIPYWDNKDPGIPDVIRDSSAASIAAAGLLELSNYAFNKDSRNKCSTAATNILRSLCSSEYLAEESNSYGILRHATWKKPTDPQSDTSLIWGDYNYLEALLRYNEANFGKDLKK